jgi:hypothetical protein
MDILIVVAALATVFACGYGGQTLFIRRTASLNSAEQLALSWLLGIGIISILLWIFGFFFRGASLPILVFSAAVSFAWMGWRRGVLPALSFRHFSAAERCLALLLALQIAVIFYLALVHTLGWDGLLNWEIKARYAYLNDGTLPASYFQDEGRRFSHQEYPLCIPLTELWLYFWLGGPDQHFAKIIFPIFYAVGVILLASSLARLTGKTYIGLVAAILLFFIPQVTVDGGSVIVGYADFPLSVCYLAAIAFLLRSIEKPNCFRAYAIALALLPWIKHDGVLLWLVGAICGAFVIVRAKQPRSHFLMLLPGLLIMGMWNGYLGYMHATTSQEFFPVTFASFRAHFHRAAPIASAVLSEFRNFSAWSILWLCVGLGCLHLLWHIRQLRSMTLLVAVLAPVVLYPATYIFSNWPDYLLHLHLSVGRLFMHIAPLGLVVAGLAAGARLQQTARGTAPSCAATVCERTPAVEFA